MVVGTPWLPARPGLRTGQSAAWGGEGRRAGRSQIHRFSKWFQIQSCSRYRAVPDTGLFQRTCRSYLVRDEARWRVGPEQGGRGSRAAVLLWTLIVYSVLGVYTVFYGC